jgi:hypothetical protein
MRRRDSPSNASSTEIVGIVDISKANGDKASGNGMRGSQVAQRAAYGIPFRLALLYRVFNLRGCGHQVFC